MKATSLLYLLLFLSLHCFGQERCKLHLGGLVLNGDNGKALAGAEVEVAGRTVKSDVAGNYDFHELCAGTYELKCSKPGFKSLSATLELKESLTEDITLYPDTFELKSVIVLGKKQKVETRRAKSLDQEQVFRQQGLSLGESLREIEGVHVVQTGPTIYKPVVQGLYGQRVLILNNGIRQESQQWGAEHAPEIDPFVFENISVVKGAASVRYGSDALGGVILLEPKPLRKKDGIEGALQFGGFSNNQMYTSSGRIEGAWKNFSARVQGSQRNAGDSKAPGYVLSNTGFREYNYSWTLAYQRKKAGAEIFYSQFNAKTGILTSAHIGNLSDLERAIASDKPLVIDPYTRDVERPYQEVAHELLKVQAFVKPLRWTKLTAAYALQYNDRDEYDKHRPYSDSLKALNNPELEMHITTNMVNATFDHNFHNEHNGSLGVYWSKQENISLGRTFIPNFVSETRAVFLTEAWQHKRWQWELGVRYEERDLQAFFYEQNILRNPEHSFKNYALSSGVNYEIRSNWKVYANLSTGFRPPHVSELYSKGLHHGTASVEIGDSTMNVEKAYSSSVSMPLSWKRGEAEIMVYHNYIENFIYLQPQLPATLTIRGAFPTFRYAQVDTRFTGVDFSLKDTLTRHWMVRLKGTVLSSREAGSGEVLYMSPPTRLETEVRYLFSSGEKIHNPYISMNLQKTFQKNGLKNRLDYASPPSGYVLLNAEAGLRLFSGRSSWWVSAGCNNLLNTEYRDYLDRFRYFAAATGRNVFLKVRLDLNKEEVKGKK